MAPQKAGATTASTVFSATDSTVARSDFVGSEALGVAADQSRKHPTRPHKIVRLK